MRREKRKHLEDELGPEAPEKQKPKTIETMREADVTFVLPSDEEVMEDEAVDEFCDHYAGKVISKILWTTGLKFTAESNLFLKDVSRSFPNSHVYSRKGYKVKKIVEYAKNRQFTHVCIVNEDRKQLNGLLICYLPHGPTALFKLSSVVLSKEIPNHTKSSDHLPELILNNFNTRLGHTIGRLFGSMFPQTPEFIGRKVVTLHNQRDFIFFRQHRYIFENASKARIQEIGPQFTLKLRYLQHGTFDSKFGEFEYLPKSENTPYARKKFVI